MPFDRFGFPFLYPTKKTAGLSNSDNGFFFQQGTDITKDSYFDNTGGEVSNSSGGQWTMNVDGPTSVRVLKNRGFINDNVIGGCNMSYSKTANRGYAYKIDDPRDMELKMAIKIDGVGDDPGLTISGPAGKFSTTCCSGNSYIGNIKYDENPMKFRFKKEMKHALQFSTPLTSHPSFNFKINGAGHWVGICLVRYNIKDGRASGKDSVKLEYWANPDPDISPTNWIKVIEYTDKGGWGNIGNDCDNDDSDQVLTWSNGCSRIKSNDSSMQIKFKNLSYREIDPSLSFDDNPETPQPDEQPTDTQTIQGKFKLLWDLNTARVSACAGTGGGGGSGGSTIFYTQPANNEKELSDSTTFQHRTRLTEYVVNSSSVFYSKIPKQVDVPLKKAGSPGASPVVSSKIWDSAGNVVYTSPTTFDPSTFTTSYVTKTFDYSTNTHSMVTGDRIGFEYTGTSSSNYVVGGYFDGDSVPNTNYQQYEGTTWDTKSREVAMTIWE